LKFKYPNPTNQIKVGKSYGRAEWREDLKICCRRAGAEVGRVEGGGSFGFRCAWTGFCDSSYQSVPQQRHGSASPLRSFVSFS